MKEKVSVLMCIYNEDIPTLKKAIYSIIQQTYKSIELIIVVDDPERKDVVLFLDDLGQDIPIRYSVNERNVGLAKSLNVGLLQCSGNYIARMDADDISSLDRIEKQMVLLKDNAYDIVGGYIQLIDENDNIIRERKDFPIKCESIREMLLFRNCIPHPTWLVRKELYQELQGYRNIKAAEDYDFLIRAAKAGAKFGMLPEICLKYRINGNGISRNNLAYQMLIMRVIQNQYKSGIQEERIINSFADEHPDDLKRNIKFYYLTKKKNKTIYNIIVIAFSRQFYREINRRIRAFIILWKDRYGHC